MNLALADVSATVLCVYDARELDAAALSCAEETHPVVITGGRSRASPRYAGPGIVPAQCDRPLPPPPPSALSLPFGNDLRAVRQHVTSAARQAGLSAGRAADLALAASEVAANTLRHAGGSGMLHVWPTADEVICQITDSGRIDDPLAGRRRPASDGSGHGLWVVNQVCDLVQLRSGRDGTMVRMHMRRRPPTRGCARWWAPLDSASAARPQWSGRGVEPGQFRLAALGLRYRSHAQTGQ